MYPIGNCYDPQVTGIEKLAKCREQVGGSDTLLFGGSKPRVDRYPDTLLFRADLSPE